MTEWDKMMAGELYSSGAPELQELHRRCRTLLYEINHLRPSEEERLADLLDKLFGRSGGVCVETPFSCDYGTNIYWGDNCYVNTGVTILDCNKVTFGNNVFIAPGVVISAAYHPTDPFLRREGEYGAPVTIGNDVWIGANVVINPGVTIGDGVTIGSGSVVTKDIPPYVVAAGVPCRVLRSVEPARNTGTDDTMNEGR